MAVTPLIKPIQNRTGAFYIFQSAVNDSNLINSQENYKFSYTKYALLRLPNIGIPAITGNTIEPKNKIQFNAIGDSPIAYDSTDNAILLAESFENYCLNFESVLLSQPQYQSSTNRSVAERVFFKWLKEIGAIRFRNANISEVSPTMTGTKFVELDETYDTNTNLTYNRVVKYVNNIT